MPSPATRPYLNRLYVRIWLAVVAAIVLLTLLVGWAWRLSAENTANNTPPTPREVVLRNAAGDIIGTAQAEPWRGPGMGLEFEVALQKDVAAGQSMSIFLPPRRRPPGADGGPIMGAKPGMPPNVKAAWFQPPFGFAWMLGLVAIAVALGCYPVIRRLTKRLDSLQQGVEQWGRGDLTTRVSLQGDDEVAFLAQRFNAAAQRIEALVASHKSLLANASHELRSPLTRIRMGLELMGSSANPATIGAFKQEILHNINELDQLIDEILLASRLDSAQAEVGTFETTDLTGLAAEECARVGAELDAQAVMVQGVPKLLRRLIRNLLENATRHARKPRPTQTVNVPTEPVLLRLHTQAQAHRDERHGELGTGAGKRTTIVLEVNDRGPGVPVNQRERIFEPFYRLPGASEREGGVGLGLALVKSIAQRHGGSVRCEAREGGGARFVVELPLV